VRKGGTQMKPVQRVHFLKKASKKQEEREQEGSKKKKRLGNEDQKEERIKSSQLSPGVKKKKTKGRGARKREGGNRER